MCDKNNKTTQARFFPFLISAVFYGFIFLSIFQLPDPIVAALVIGIAMVILLPVACGLYGRKVLLHSNQKIGFSLYNALAITLPYILMYLDEGETYMYGLILFAWTFLWTILFTFKKENPSI